MRRIISISIRRRNGNHRSATTDIAGAPDCVHPFVPFFPPRPIRNIASFFAKQI